MAAKKTSLVIKVQIGGVWETLRAFRDLPPEASDAIRTTSAALAGELVADVQAAARREGRQAALLAGTVKVLRDRVPAVQAGGTTRLGRRRRPAYKLLFGSEFGSNRLKQYRPHLGSGSYWFFDTVEDQYPAIARRWMEAADRIIAEWSGGE